MNPTPLPSTIPPPAERRMPEPLRNAVTVAVAVYLTGLVLGVAGNSGSGSSALVRTVKSRLFSPWLVPAWLDLGFDQRLTHGSADDADHVLELAGHGRAGGSLRRFPGAVTGERARRWRRLARALARPEGADELVAAVGRGGFDDLATDDLTVRVLRHEMHHRSAAAAPGMERVFAARVRLVDGEVQLLRFEPRGELAPLLEPAGRAEPAGESP